MDAQRKLSGAGKKLAIHVNPERPVRSSLHPPHEGRFYPAQLKVLSRPNFEKDRDTKDAGIMADGDEV